MSEKSHSHTKAYCFVFLALVCLTILTVAVSYVHLGGAGNIIVGILIAMCKASLVVMVFMHLKYDGKFDRIFYLSALFPLTLVGILMLPPLLDISWLPHLLSW